MSNELYRCVLCDVSLSTTDPSWWWCATGCDKKFCKNCYRNQDKHTCPSPSRKMVSESDVKRQVAAAVAEQKRVDAGILQQYIDEANVIDNPETGVKGVLFSLKCLQLVWLLKKIKSEIEGQV